MKRQAFLTPKALASRKRKSVIILLMVVSLLSSHLPVFATPPEMPSLPDPITAYIVFVYFPNARGRFEVEVFCEANFDIEWLSLQVAHTEEITFDEKLPSFTGGMKIGESKVWRIKGRVHGPGLIDDFEMPASANLVVEYLFPYEKVLKEVERQHDPYTRKMLLRDLEELRGNTMTILRAILVELPRTVALTPADISWVDGPPSLPPGAQYAILEGGLETPGPFTVRFKFSSDYRIPPHWYPTDQRITVMSGTLNIRLEDNLASPYKKALPTGSFVMIPAKTICVAWTEEETIIQVHGFGPWRVSYVSR